MTEEEYKEKKQTFDKELKDALKNCICIDGHYPNYFSQPVKVLIIGREARGMGNANYIEAMLDAFQSGKVAKGRGGESSLDNADFERRCLKFAYGLIKKEKDYSKIPTATKIGKDIGKQDGISFAFMNLSKFSNDTDKFKTNFSRINAYLNASNEKNNHFIQRQIELENPDIILTNYLEKGSFVQDENYLQTIFKKMDLKSFGKYPSETENICQKYHITIKNGDNNRTCPLLDLYHFSKFPGRRFDEQNFWIPIVQALDDENFFQTAESPHT